MRRTLERLARFTPGADVTVTPHDLSSVKHSALGDVTSNMSQGGVTIQNGEHVYADFKGALRGADATQDWFLEVTGAHVPLGTNASAAAMAEGRQAVAPLRFALQRNRPNPYSATSSMRFALPSATNVRMELFDLQGRRLRTLASGRMEAGWHSVTLDRRQERGASLPAGVYLCRLVAGRDRAERKVVVMP